MKALPPRGLSVLAVEHVLVGMLWPDAEHGVGWQRWGVAALVLLQSGPYYCFTISKWGFGPKLLAVPVVFGMRNAECKPYKVAGWAGNGIEFCPASELLCCSHCSVIF